MPVHTRWGCHDQYWPPSSHVLRNTFHYYLPTYCPMSTGPLTAP